MCIIKKSMDFEETVCQIILLAMWKRLKNYSFMSTGELQFATTHCCVKITEHSCK
jgi:hypothetical protein